MNMHVESTFIYNTLLAIMPMLLNTKAAQSAATETVKKIFEVIQKKPAAQEALLQLEINPSDLQANQVITEEVKNILLENPDLTKQLLQQLSSSVDINQIHVGQGAVNIGAPIGEQTLNFN